MNQERVAGCGCAADQAARLERRTLWIVLAINAAMFVMELGFGLRARSTGLIADSLDMLADDTRRRGRAPTRPKARACAAALRALRRGTGRQLAAEGEAC